MKKTFFSRNGIYIACFILFCTSILLLSLRGINGNPHGQDLLMPIWRENGPFELSPERGRFALMYSIIEDKSLSFSKYVAEFAAPDVGINNGKYVSLFAPALSYLIIPGYIIGKMFGSSQMGTFAMISIFAIINMIILRKIALNLGANKLAASVSSLVFLFATPAYAYAVNLYQHHVSTFLMLLSIYALLKFKKTFALLTVFFVFAASIPLDYPNIFFISPLAIFAGLQIFSFKNLRKKMTIKFNILMSLTLLVMIIPISFFMWFNKESYGNPFQLSGTVQSADFNEDFKQQVEKDIKNDPYLEAVNPEKDENGKSAFGFFKTRNLVEGFYILFVSPDRGIIYYTPIMLFGLIGMLLAYKSKIKLYPVLCAVIFMNILLYSMWGDPWGGWAFGSRYLIPSYAILSIFIALLLTYWKKNYIFLILFSIVAIYSIFVNTLGAITTSALPPQVQVLHLEELSGMVQKYTYERNWDMLVSGHSKSFVYQTYLEEYLTATQFYFVLASSITLLYVVLIVFLYINYRKKNEVT